MMKLNIASAPLEGGIDANPTLADALDRMQQISRSLSALCERSRIVAVCLSGDGDPKAGGQDRDGNSVSLVHDLHANMASAEMKISWLALDLERAIGALGYAASLDGEGKGDTDG